MQKIKTYKDFIEIASLFFALLIAFWIPELKFVLSYFIGLWFLLTIVQLDFKTRLKLNLNTRFKKIIFFSQIILFFIILSELFFAENTTDVSKNITQKLSFLLFPILFSLSGDKFKQKKNLFLKLFVISNIVVSVICLLLAFYNSSSIVDGNYIFNTQVNKWYNYFMSDYLTIFHHRGYFSMYLVFSVAIIFYFKENRIWFKSKKTHLWFYLLVVFLSVMVFLLSSRTGIITLSLLILFKIVYKIILLKKTIYKIIIVIIIPFVVFIVFKNKRMQYTLTKMERVKHEGLLNKKTDARIILWKSAIDIIKDNFYTGIGIEHFKEKYLKQYKKYNNLEIDKRKDFTYNVHNQFLEVWVLYGFFVFLFFIAMFILPILHSIRNKQYLFLTFMLILGFNFLIESVLERISGIIFFVYFLNYFVFVFNEKEKSQITIL